MDKEVVYVAELDADIDDVVAAEYLFNKGVLKCVVADPLPKTIQGKERQKALENIGITVVNKMPAVSKFVFVGGALTEVARYIHMHHIDTLVMNGGFVGSNIVSSNNQLDKFKGKTFVRTFNFNCDINATDYVLKSSEKQIWKIILVGKNICHSSRNTETGLWNDKESLKLFKKYNVKPGKRQHDMLACHEGLAMLGLGGITTPYTEFLDVRPTNNGLNGNMTVWGSVKLETDGNTESSKYRKVIASVKIIGD